MASNKNKMFTNLLTGAAACALLTAPALAQEAETVPAPEAPAAAEEEKTLEKIVVTGSLLRRDDFSSASPMQVLTADTATLEGLVTAADILQGSSIAAGSVQLNNQFGGFVVDGGLGVNTISLRGLGDQRTLVLLNGRRPGPSGTRGAVGAFDLNVIPNAAVTRFEILKDGASTIYGSDAVGGVVNVITRTSIDKPELTVQANAPFEGGGESLQIDGGFGLNFDTGNFTFTGQYTSREDLSIGDRDFLKCDDDYVFDAPGGNRIDREDRSINAGTANAGCSNIYANTILNAFNFGQRWVPTADGSSDGILDGYALRTNGRYDDGEGAVAYYDDDLYDERVNSSDAINKQELLSLFATSDFSFDILGGLNWKGEALYTKRETTGEQWRQFFPYIGGDAGFGFYPYDEPYADNIIPSGLALPITAFPSNDKIELEYTSFASTFEGGFSATGAEYLKDWVWSADFSYSKSDGDYTGNEILKSASGDVFETGTPPAFNPFDPSWLDGTDTSWYDIVQSFETGNTIYEQQIARFIVNGPVFSLPAGEVLMGAGIEGRKYEIDDEPSENSQNALLWGTSTALPTKGEEDVFEYFGEIDIPIFKGQPFAEELTVNLSGRGFNYSTYGTGDVWKAQVNWQVTPSFRVRGTQGTSFRAPGLFETYQGATTSFLSQFAIDPCVDWGDSTNTNLRTNCAAEGIPEDYSPVGASATIVSGGGGGLLTPETSEAKTFGVIFTPSFTNLSLAIDYFSIEVDNQIAQLGSSTILGACYVADNFPNSFCDLFDRNSATDATSPLSITQVRDFYINVNSQETEGIDITARYEKEFNFGTLEIEAQATRTFSDVRNLFSTTEESGFETDDFNGTIGEPKWVGNSRVSLDHGDFKFSWFMDYIGMGDNTEFEDANATYFGADAFYVFKTDAVLYHDFSVQWTSDDISVTAGIQNAFDEDPPSISNASFTSRRGTVPLSAGYDLRGRTGFVRVTKKF
ncbi:TonB-dependent receptor plug domain-containing protein [Hirschia maritima]|uniref:TonB-dependent receptor plug domain-containing protein n=1 Tax=Hirschia maritima TaxID=1121961 RepID=UPI00035EE1EF|nr:TonB-dependent receptor [Hirschia maritima]